MMAGARIVEELSHRYKTRKKSLQSTAQAVSGYCLLDLPTFPNEGVLWAAA